MPWTETTRRCARHASDLTDAEWALIEPLMPAPNRIGRAAEDGPARGRERAALHDFAGRSMAASAEGLPTVFDGAEVLLALAGRRIAARINNVLVLAAREREGPGGKPVRRRHRHMGCSA